MSSLIIMVAVLLMFVFSVVILLAARRSGRLPPARGGCRRGALAARKCRLYFLFALVSHQLAPPREGSFPTPGDKMEPWMELQPPFRRPAIKFA
jgi:hypothetical protein